MVYHSILFYIPSDKNYNNNNKLWLCDQKVVTVSNSMVLGLLKQLTLGQELLSSGTASHPFLGLMVLAILYAKQIMKVFIVNIFCVCVHIFYWKRMFTGYKQMTCGCTQYKPLPRSTANSTLTICILILFSTIRLEVYHLKHS
jgi:hypothetical protein